jgi:hypothetical protein
MDKGEMMTIFNPKSVYTEDKTVRKVVEKGVAYYTVAGDQDFNDQDEYPRREQDDIKVYAKTLLRKDGSYKYMCKTVTTGKLYDAVAKYGVKEDVQFLDRVCRSNDKFKEVNHKVFSLYIKFLKTKNKGYLLNAERELE